MSTESENAKSESRKNRRYHPGNQAGAVYGLGFIGACVYYFSTATTFWIGVLGFLKAMVWPAFLVFEAMKALGM